MRITWFVSAVQDEARMAIVDGTGLRPAAPSVWHGPFVSTSKAALEKALRGRKGGGGAREAALGFAAVFGRVSR